MRCGSARCESIFWAPLRRTLTQLRNVYPRDRLIVVGGGAPIPPLDPAQRLIVERWSRGRRVPFRVVIRARIVLLASAGMTNRQIAKELQVTPVTVALWKSRFALLGLDGISRDAPRVGSRRGLSDVTLRAIVSKTLQEAPPNGKSWSSRSLARAVGVSHSTVLRVWRAHRVHQYRTPIAALAHDPRFQPHAIAVAGVYLHRPNAAVVISDRIPEKSRTQKPEPRRLESGTRSSPREPPTSPGELVQLLARLEDVPTGRSSARLARKEFLAFLASAANRGGPGAQHHLLVHQPDESIRSAVDKWGSPASEMRLVHSGSAGSLHEMVKDWLSERSKAPRTRVVLDEVADLRRAVDRWADRQSGGPRPFAWVSPRNP